MIINVLENGMRDKLVRIVLRINVFSTVDTRDIKYT